MMIVLGAGYAETCKSGSGGGPAETAAVSQYGAAVPTSHITIRSLQGYFPFRGTVNDSFTVS